MLIMGLLAFSNSMTPATVVAALIACVSKAVFDLISIRLIHPVPRICIFKDHS